MSKENKEGNFAPEYYQLLELLAFLVWGSDESIPIDLQIKKTDERGKIEFAVTLHDPREKEDFWIDTFKTRKAAERFVKEYLHCVIVESTLKSGEKIISLEAVEEK